MQAGVFPKRAGDPIQRKSVYRVRRVAFND